MVQVYLNLFMKLDNKLFKNLKKKNVNFITIDGITCSGKSLFAELLKKNLKSYYRGIYFKQRFIYIQEPKE